MHLIGGKGPVTAAVLRRRHAHAAAKKLTQTVAICEPDLARNLVGGKPRIRQQLSRVFDSDFTQIVRRRLAEMALKMTQKGTPAQFALARHIGHANGTM